MIFTSQIFIFFLLFLLLLYKFIVNSLRGYLLIIASLIFYASWSVPFTFLLITFSFFIFLFGKLLYKYKKMNIFYISILFSIFPLLFFKYKFFLLENLNYFFGYDFFISNSIFLPLGISFFTFQGLSYLIDVKNKVIRPEKNFFLILLYISFFPQLVAGPIEKANKLIPQLKKLFAFKEIKIPKSELKFALFLILLGFFKKLVIADNLGILVDFLYSNSLNLNFYTAILLMLSFSFQIYFDFSSYSQIARGVAKLFGINLMINFNFPYLATNISEFWRKWHISLSTWFKDYIYIPLGGNRSGTSIKIRNLLIVFFLCGLWHGASWLFILWGFYHGFLYLIYYSYNYFRNKFHLFIEKNIIYKSLSIFLTFISVSFGWIIFISSDFDILNQIVLSFFNFNETNLNGVNNLLSKFFIHNGRANYLFLYIYCFILIYFIFGLLYPFINRKFKDNLVNFFFIPLIVLSYFFANQDTNTFIYFQF